MNQPNNIARRYFLRDCGVGLGKLAAASLLAGSVARGAEPSQFPVKKSHHTPKAKAVIHLFMAGAPSHLDLFDYKPELAKWEGKSLPEAVTSKQRFAFIRADAAVMGPRFKFKKFGKAGTEIAEVLPHWGGVTGPTQHRLLGLVRAWFGSQRFALVRRDVHGKWHQRRCRQLVERVFADHLYRRAIP